VIAGSFGSTIAAMAQTVLHFHQLRQAAQGIAVTDVGDYMIAEVVFDIEVDEHRQTGLSCVVRQAAGSNFEKEPLEVDAPAGYSGPAFDYDTFRSCVEAFFRRVIGEMATGIRVDTAGVGGFHMAGNVFRNEWTCPEPGTNRAS
jgi:hypothetical protein